jgi:hypothetical protein
MTTIYIIIGILAALLLLYLFFGRKLRRNKPNIKGELEIFPILEKKPEGEFIPLSTAKVPERQVINSLGERSRVMKKKEEIEFPPATKVDSIELDLEVTIDWFERQKQKALRQLKRYKFHSLEFIPNWTFEENGETIQTRGYLLDASNTLDEVISKHLKDKERIVFYLSKESDGIYHVQKVSGGNKNEATVTVQVWHSDN